ncbi:ArsR/SmtB family transcription factor [Heyndrickxia acidicola]|uniref:Helix-turn-helix domain-containing protein n=1 Tax=Heyndrickxia acidicola TaxID=209389 RepID=A0ABU6MF48_9BACI|nr:helix-turn-helix domain-containing protein [Heyndrickxia acidicola]MED1203307.1 helix-turn-helix domain-containing protein [Heyndrickxia acidicola]
MKQLDVLDITSFEQAKVLSHELRRRILSQYTDNQVPRTAKQLADQMNLPASKVHYHVRELVKAGLLGLTGTNEVNGIVEKYYLPVAKDFRIVLKDMDTQLEGKQKIINQTLTEFRKGFLQAMAEEAENSMLDVYHLHLTASEKEELTKEIKSLGEKWHQKVKERETDEMKSQYEIVLSVYKKESD